MLATLQDKRYSRSIEMVKLQSGAEGGLVRGIAVDEPGIPVVPKTATIIR